jgi:hypothetical protein
MSLFTNKYNILEKNDGLGEVGKMETDSSSSSISVKIWIVVTLTGVIITAAATIIAALIQSGQLNEIIDNNQTTNCPSTRSEAASLIGGEPQYWTAPDWSGGAWVYRNKGEFISLDYPGFGRLDVWINGVVEISSANADLLSRYQFDEASFHCSVQ